jgi:deazaflavin-dependent oxidoreductase (nitroreductase family)
MTDLGLAPPVSAVLEVRGRTSGKLYATPVVVARFEGAEYLVSMLGTQSSWVKNVEAAGGAATLRQTATRCIGSRPSPVPTSNAVPNPTRRQT